jgi:XTP/dITP diphosphohydrolase
LKGGGDTPESSEVLFATSNKHKVAEAEVVLAEFGLKVRPADIKGIEVQSDDISIVASYASRGAAESAGGPVIVEDAGLFVESLNGFPGPYSSYVYQKVGVDGILRLLGGIPERRAFFRSAVAYCEPGTVPSVFEGAVQGWIVTSPAGSDGFGFDPIFAPEGMDQTLAEISLKEKCRISHRAISFRKFGTWFTERNRKD